ncbi:MAG: glucoamylase family protein [Gemmatimonadaceae bacterium]
MSLIRLRSVAARGTAAARTVRAAVLLPTALFTLGAGAAGCARGALTGPSVDLRNDAFIDTLEVRTFRWFWETTNPRNGLTPDRWPTKSFSSIAAVGFALTAYGIGVERGYVTRPEAAERVLTTLRFFWEAPQGPQASGVSGHYGFFYHFLDMDTGQRFAQVELSTIDTTLLLGGVLFCREYFDGSNASEVTIRAYADSLFRRVDWRWAQPRAPFVSMGWHPERGFIQHDWRGFNEAMLLYVLALGSPTHPIEASAWDGWTSTYQWGEFYGQAHVNFAPLFGHQYSHVWIDFRGISDAYMRNRGMDYFENARRATQAQRAYATANPGGWRGYSANVWGLTASDGPNDTTVTIDGQERKFFSYRARGAAANEVVDDGTLVPTAAGGSLAFAPEIAVPALRAMRAQYGDDVFGQYGFVDAFNPTFQLPAQLGRGLKHGRVVAGKGWFDTDYLGIDQGPIIAMIENYRSGLVWDRMKRSPYVVRGLCRAGFTGGWLAEKC